jgi:integrase-like protein
VTSLRCGHRVWVERTAAVSWSIRCESRRLGAPLHSPDRAVPHPNEHQFEGDMGITDELAEIVSKPAKEHVLVRFELLSARSQQVVLLVQTSFVGNCNHGRLAWIERARGEGRRQGKQGAPALLPTVRSNGSRNICRGVEMDRVGFDKKVTAHILRHTMATTLLFNGCPIGHIKVMLGHERLDTTCRYCLRPARLDSLAGWNSWRERGGHHALVDIAPFCVRR